MVLRAAAIILAVIAASCSNLAKTPSSVTPPTPRFALSTLTAVEPSTNRADGDMRLGTVFTAEYEDIANRLFWKRSRYRQSVGDHRQILFTCQFESEIRVVEPPLISKFSPCWTNAAAHCAMRVFSAGRRLSRCANGDSLGRGDCRNRAAMGLRTRPRTESKSRSRRDVSGETPNWEESSVTESWLVDEQGVSTRIDVERAEIRRAGYRMPNLIVDRLKPNIVFKHHLGHLRHL